MMSFNEMDSCGSSLKSAVADIDLLGCFVVNTSTELIPDDQEVVDILAKNKLNFQEIFFQYLKKGQGEGGN